MVLGLVLGLLEGEVVLDGAAGEPGLLVLAGGDGGGSDPEGTKKGEGGEEGQEEGRLQTAAELPRQVQGHTAQDGEEEEVGEALAARAVGGQRSILDGRILAGACQQRSIGLVAALGDLTDVVRTPHSSNFSKVGVGALGVSMNSNSDSLPLAL